MVLACHGARSIHRRSRFWTTTTFRTGRFCQCLLTCGVGVRMSGNSRQTCSEAPCDCRFSLTAGSDSHGIVHGAAECGAQALHLNGNLLGESPETQREIRELVRAGMCGTFRGCSAPRHRGSSSSCGRPNAKAPNSETPKQGEASRGSLCIISQSTCASSRRGTFLERKQVGSFSACCKGHLQLCLWVLDGFG